MMNFDQRCNLTAWDPTVDYNGLTLWDSWLTYTFWCMMMSSHMSLGDGGDSAVDGLVAKGFAGFILHSYETAPMITNILGICANFGASSYLNCDGEGDAGYPLYFVVPV